MRIALALAAYEMLPTGDAFDPTAAEVAGTVASDPSVDPADVYPEDVVLVPEDQVTVSLDDATGSTTIMGDPDFVENAIIDEVVDGDLDPDEGEALINVIEVAEEGDDLGPGNTESEIVVGADEDFDIE